MLTSSELFEHDSKAPFSINLKNFLARRENLALKSSLFHEVVNQLILLHLSSTFGTSQSLIDFIIIFFFKCVL
jgi:hypothetical protein